MTAEAKIPIMVEKTDIYTGQGFSHSVVDGLSWTSALHVHPKILQENG